MKIPDRQFEMLCWIDRYIHDNGWAPSTVEIAHGMGIKYTYGVRKQLASLMQKGLIKRVKGGARMMIVTEAGRAAIA